MAQDLNDLSRYLNSIKFKRKIIGGIDEVDVWNKIEKLNLEYKELYDRQKAQIELLEKKLNEK